VVKGPVSYSVQTQTRVCLCDQTAVTYLTECYSVTRSDLKQKQKSRLTGVVCCAERFSDVQHIWMDYCMNCNH